MLTKPLPDTHHGVDRCDHATVNGTPLISINTEYYSDIDCCDRLVGSGVVTFG